MQSHSSSSNRIAPHTHNQIARLSTSRPHRSPSSIAPPPPVHSPTSTMFRNSPVPVSGLKVGGRRCKSLSSSERTSLPKDATIAPSAPSTWSPQSWLTPWISGSGSSPDGDRDSNAQREDDSATGARKTLEQKKADRKKAVAERKARELEKAEQRQRELERWGWKQKQKQK